MIGKSKIRKAAAVAVAVIAIAIGATAAVAMTRSEFVTGFASAALPASSAWAEGSSATMSNAEVARLYCKYTSHASATAGRCEYKVQLSPDSATTWYDYAVCDDAAASQAGATYAIDEWEAQCYVRVWTHDTAGAGSKAQALPVLEFDLRGVAGDSSQAGRIRVLAREVGDTTNRGTFACTWGLGRIER